MVDLTRRKFLATVGTTATLVALGPWVSPLRRDPDEPVWAWDPPHGLWAGLRKFLPDHLRGQETVGAFHIDIPEGVSGVDFRSGKVVFT